MSTNHMMIIVVANVETLKLPISTMNSLEYIEVEETNLKSWALGAKIEREVQELDVKKNKILQSIDVSALTEVQELRIRRNPNLKHITFKDGIPVVTDEINFTTNPKLQCSCDFMKLLKQAQPKKGRRPGIKVRGVCTSKQGRRIFLNMVTT